MDIRILIVDDHPSMIEGYKVILSYNDFGYNIDIRLLIIVKVL
ncbi:hypothetical protein [Flavobacterium columnare]|nr:hypothetical protein [Flavobacterium columnare]